MRRRHQVPGKAEMIRKQRIALALIGFAILCFGVGALSRGHLHYRNWWGAAVFAPFAIVVSILAFAAALKWRSREPEAFNTIRLKDRHDHSQL